VRIAFLTTGATASASEININTMAPWVEIAIVGEDTFGKPVGQLAFDLQGCEDRLRLVAFRIENARGEGDYYDGLAATLPFACALPTLDSRSDLPAGSPGGARIGSEPAQRDSGAALPDLRARREHHPPPQHLRPRSSLPGVWGLTTKGMMSASISRPSPASLPSLAGHRQRERQRPSGVRPASTNAPNRSIRA
jgi:hypothetical protein